MLMLLIIIMLLVGGVVPKKIMSKIMIRSRNNYSSTMAATVSPLWNVAPGGTRTRALARLKP